MDDITQQINNLIQRFPQLAKEANAAKTSLKELLDSRADTTKLRETFDKLNETVGKGGVDAAKGLIDQIKTLSTEGVAGVKSLVDGFSGLLTAVNYAKDAATLLINEIGNTDGTSNLKEMTAGAVSLAAALGGLNAASLFADVNREAERTNIGLKNMLEFAKNTKLDLLPTEKIQNLLTASDAAKNFENSMYRMAASSGALGNLLPTFEDGNLSTGLDEAVDKIHTSTIKSATNMGMSYELAIGKTMQLLKLLPAEFDKTGDNIVKLYDVLDDSSPVSAFELLETTARGTGQTFDTVSEIANKMWGLFASDAKEAAERVSILSKVSTDLKIPFETLKGTIQGIDDQFKMWGNNAESALGVLTQISEALKDQGIGYEAQLEIVRSLSGAIGNLSIEKKAFIGMESGLGGGAISAGLQVEKMLQEGDMSKVAGMLQETLGQIGGTGGRVVSLDEAIETPGQEQAFMAQRMALGQIFGVQDTGTQNRLMDVMSKVSLGTEMETGSQDALKEAFGKGEAIQQKQFNVLENIYTEQVAVRQILAGRKSYEESQNLLGRGAGLDNIALATAAEAQRLQPQSVDLTTSAGRANAMFNLESFDVLNDKLKEVGARITEGIGKVLEEFDIKVKESRNLDVRRNAENERFAQQSRDNTDGVIAPQGNDANVTAFQEGAASLTQSFTTAVDSVSGVMSSVVTNMIDSIANMEPQETKVAFEPFIINLVTPENEKHTAILRPTITQGPGSPVGQNYPR